MALEAITQQQQYLYALLGNANWDAGSGSGSGSGFDYYSNEAFDEFLSNHQNVAAPLAYEDYSNWNLPPPLLVDSQNEFHQWGQNSSYVLDHNFAIPDQQEEQPQLESPVEMPRSTTRPRGRRTRTKKNEEEIENQRMTHIAVERNRRKQMNDYLSVLRTLMPESYVQRADQASIVSGTINYVKELEQQLQFLSGQKHLTSQNQDANGEISPFSEFFSMPQYSTTMTAATSEKGACENEYYRNQQLPATADIEVTMVENHANLKIRSKRRPRLLPRIISGLESLRLTVLHLNFSKVDQFVLCSLSLKVEEDCKMSSVEDIAAVVNQILSRIHEEAN